MIDALRTAGGVRVAILLLALVLALAPGLGLAQEEAAEDGSPMWAVLMPWAAWMAGLIPWETVFGVVKHDDAAKTLANGILVAAFCFWVWLLFLWGRNISRLKKVQVRILNIPENFYEFAERFPELRRQLERMPFPNIRHAWNEFAESLFMEKDETERRIVYNTSSPDNFFNLQKLGMHFPFYQALPNYFVGLGLLLTFFGLAAALFFAGGAIAKGGSVSDTEAALRNLLSAATLKFMTSIAGLASSLALGFTALLAKRHISGVCAEICDNLEKRVQFAAQARFAFMLWGELQKHTAQLERFNTDLAVSIADALAPRIASSVRDGVSEVMRPLSDSIEGFANSMRSANKEDIQEIARGIPEQMQKAADTIALAQQNISAVAAELREVTGNLSGQIGEAGGQFGVRMNEASVAVGDIVSGIGREIAGLKGVVEGLGEMLAGQQREFEELAKATRGAAVGAAKEAISGVAGELQTASSGLSSQIGEAGGKFGREMDAASRAVGGAVSGISAEVATLRGVISGLGETLGSQLKEFDALAKATQGAADSLSRAAAQHDQSAQPIAAAARQISAAAETIRGMGDKVQATHESLQDIHARIEESSTQLRRFWEQHDARFEHVDKDLEQVIQKIMDGNDACRQSVTEFAVGVADSMKGALNRLGDAISELNDAVQELEELRAGGNPPATAGVGCARTRGFVPQRDQRRGRRRFLLRVRVGHDDGIPVHLHHHADVFCPPAQHRRGESAERHHATGQRRGNAHPDSEGHSLPIEIPRHYRRSGRRKRDSAAAGKIALLEGQRGHNQTGTRGYRACRLRHVHRDAVLCGKTRSA